MKKLLLFVGIFLVCSAFSLRIEAPVTTYTDGTPIEASLLPVMYNAWQDGVQIANKSTALLFPLADNTYGATHIFTVQSVLSDGRKSAISAGVSLTSPLDQRLPGLPAAPYQIVP